MKMKVFTLFAVVVLTFAWWLWASRSFGGPLDGMIVYMIAGWLFAAIVVLAVERVTYAAWIAAVVVLSYSWWQVTRFMFGTATLGGGIGWVIIGWTFAAIVVFAARRVPDAVWIAAGLVILATLCLPDLVLLEIARRLPQPLTGPQGLVYLVVFPLALVVGALLLHSALKFYQAEPASSPGRRKPTGRIVAVCAGVCALLLAKVLHTFYWFMVWDTTDDPLGNSWLLLPVLIVLFCSAVLFFLLPGRVRLAGLMYLLLIPALIGLSTGAQSVGFRARTGERAGQVSQAIEAYYAREGRYPQDLQQLTPFYILSLPAPVIMFGQGWCYQAGQDYYRFGYLDREHWSSPIVFGRLYSYQGHSPLRMDVCQSVMDVYRTQHPDLDRALQEYGQPTPTPDIRE